jgi:hypothetical protein
MSEQIMFEKTMFKKTMFKQTMSEQTMLEQMMFKPKQLLRFLILIALCCCCGTDVDDIRETWIDKPHDQWPQIAMINEITYLDQHYPVAGCSFLLDTGSDTVAVTAKHVLIYFKSDMMKAVSFENTLVSWKMYPKDNPTDVVVVDRLINENPAEQIEYIPSRKDWLLFSITEASPKIQPLTLRESPFVPDERVYIVGWRYTDIDCRQRIYEGRSVSSSDGAVLISTKELADNTIPGLSGAPVIDSKGRLIGLMSQKQGQMEQLAGIEYAREVLDRAAGE